MLSKKLERKKTTDQQHFKPPFQSSAGVLSAPPAHGSSRSGATAAIRRQGEGWPTSPIRRRDQWENRHADASLETGSYDLMQRNGDHAGQGSVKRGVAWNRRGDTKQGSVQRDELDGIPATGKGTGNIAGKARQASGRQINLRKWLSFHAQN